MLSNNKIKEASGGGGVWVRAWIEGTGAEEVLQKAEF